jgi:DNA modification methylase
VDSIKEPTVDGKELKRKRSVWEVTTKPYKGSHFAVYPPELIEPCIIAGSREGDIILDPFMGSGTTAAVAKSLGRNYIGCELHEEYGKLIEKRVSETVGLLEFLV